MEILSIDSQQAQKRRLSEKLGIALTHSFSDLDNIIGEELLLEGFIVVYVESGRGSFSISEQECRIEAGEMLIANYGQRISNMLVSPNIQFRAFFLNRELVESLINHLSLNWTIRSGIVFFTYIKFSLTSIEQSNVCRYYELLDSKRQQTRHQQEVIDALCKAFGYELLDLMEHHGFLCNDTTVQQSGGFDAAHQHYNAFMHLLLDAPVINRKVSYYAEQLNITAKYLDLVCLQVAQQSPSALIEREVIQRATLMLHDSPLSVKQIASQLGFNNQSHFGTYIRRVTGKSPQQLRGEG